MHLIVCLGNPGTEYKQTRHNIGFMAGETLLSNMSTMNRREKFHSQCVSGTLGNSPILVLFPLTYMNLSGKAVTAAMSFYKIQPENIVVLYDDLDIPFGHLRFREKGSAGTHNGMRSIVGDIGSNFTRLRMGIGPKPEGYDTSGFVLGRFTPTETAQLPKICAAAAETVQQWITKGKDAATRTAAAFATTTATTPTSTPPTQ